MKKRLIIGIVLAALICNISVFADNYWETANDDITTGIGSEEADESVAGTIEDYIKNGWSAEFAEVNETISDTYVSPYQNEINLVLGLGLMENDGDKSDFRPLDKLTYYEYAKAAAVLTKYSGMNLSALSETQNIVSCETVIKDMITLLGYDYFYEGDSLSIAARCGILDGLKLKAVDSITREQFAKLLVNTLKIDKVEVNIGTTVTYEIVKDSTLLSSMKVTEVTGFVNATEYTNMYSTNEASKGCVQIDLKEYNIGKSNAQKYLGRYVKAYILEDDGIETVVSIDIYEKKDNYLLIPADDIEEVTKTGIEYYQRNSEGELSNRASNKKFSPNGTVIYNGKYIGTVASVKENLLTPVTGRIEMTDSDFDGKYDCIFVWNYEVAVVENVSGTRVLLKDDKGIIDLSDDDKTVILTLDGENIPISDLAKWNVLSIAKTKDEDMYTVEVGINSFRGVCVKIDRDEIEMESGEQYTLDNSFTTKLEYNKEYTFYLTADEKVAIADEFVQASTKTGTGRNYGYLRKALLDDDDEDAASFRIFRLSDSSWVTLKGAEKVNFYSGAVEGEEKTSEVKKRRLTPAVIAAELTKPQLVVFETNIKGQLTSITTSVDLTATGELNDEIFACNKYFENNVRTYYGGYFGGYYHIGTALLLKVPTDREQEKYYSLETISADGNVKGPMEIYDVNESMVMSGVIVRYVDESASVSNESQKIVIKAITEEYVNDENVFKITTLDDKEYYIETADEKIGLESVTKNSLGKSMWNVEYAKDLKKGDMCLATVNSLGYITSFRVDVRIPELADMNYFAYASNDNPPQLTYDYGVVKKNPSTPNVVINTSDDVTNVLNDKVRVVSAGLYSYNTKTGKFEKLNSKNDILPGDRIITRATYYYTGTTTIVIK